MMEFRFRDADENSQATDAQASVLDDGLEAGHLGAFPGVVNGLHVGVGPYEHGVILAALRLSHERTEFLSSPISRPWHGRRFFRLRRKRHDVARALC